MIIDAHVHPVFRETPATPEIARMIQNLEQTSKNYYCRSQNILSLADFQQEMKSAGIDRVVLQVSASKGSPANPVNEQVSMLMRMFPDSFMGFAGFNPHQGEQAVADIVHAIKDLGYKGLKTVSPTLELDINDKAYYPCYAKAQELGVPIMIHTGASTLVMGYRVKYAQPLMIDDVAFDFPDLKIICAHMGGHSFMDVQSLLVRHQNVYADLSFWSLHPLYKDLIPWRILEETVSDKILLGSDYPCAQTPKEAVETVKTLLISEAFKQKILGKNAERLLSKS
jgi:predicted TIM-barrel fold metal-dependent hydrolase